MADPNELQVLAHFPTFIYRADRPDFLPVVREVAFDALAAIKSVNSELNEIYPVFMTHSFYADPRMLEFSQFVGQTAWNILLAQGYAMQPLTTHFTEMWCQEHYKHSAMDQHVHGDGSQLVGFYFLDCPEGSSRLMFHDPKAGKVQIGLAEVDANLATPASNVINFTPQPGMMIFANSWLPHSFSRHAADEPCRFVHFNIGVGSVPHSHSHGDLPICGPTAEVI